MSKFISYVHDDTAAICLAGLRWAKKSTYRFSQTYSYRIEVAYKGQELIIEYEHETRKEAKEARDAMYEKVIGAIDSNQNRHSRKSESPEVVG